MPFIEVGDGARLFHKDWGEGDPVVLIHGWPLDADLWEFPQRTLAEAGLRTVAYDRRGVGRSDQAWDGYDHDALADDLRSVLDALDLRKATLVGSSMGGGEVARYMSRHGGAGIAKAALVSSVTPYLLKSADNPDGVDRSVSDGMIDGLGRGRPHFLANFSKTFFGAGAFSSPVSLDLMQWTGSLAMRASPKATIDCVRAFSGTDFRADTAALDVPTLVIHGDGDATVPFEVSGKATAEAIPGATLIVYEGAPHAVPFTHAERLNADPLSFLRC